ATRRGLHIAVDLVFKELLIPEGICRVEGADSGQGHTTGGPHMRGINAVVGFASRLWAQIARPIRSIQFSRIDGSPGLMLRLVFGALPLEVSRPRLGSLWWSQSEPHRRQCQLR